MDISKYILFFVAFVSFSVASFAGNSAYEEAVRVKCGHTMYTTLCVETLMGLERKNQHADFLYALVNKTIHETVLPESYVNDDRCGGSSVEICQLVATTAANCQELMAMSLKRLNQALTVLQTSPEKQKSDIQTWLSAAITFQQTCKDIVEEHAPSNPHMAQIYNKMEHLSQLSSNSLALVNRITGTDRHRFLQEDFPSWISTRQRKLLQSTGIKANAVVAKDGTGNFKTIGEAIRAATGVRFEIYVKAGVYNEKIVCDKDGITLVGDGKYSTIISGCGSVGGGSSLLDSSTFTVNGDGFIARDIGFQNTAGPEKHQAIALTVASDRSVFYRCSIAGYQDTLFALSLRQFYRECDILGTIDFIFGNAAAVFQSCTLILRRPRVGGAFNAILANGRTDPGQNTGYSVQNCKITVGSDFAPVKNSYDSYLGRPWKAYSRAVVMQTYIDAEISSRGWVEWKGATSSTYRSLYFSEYANTGPGAQTSGRVNWPGFHVIGTSEATKFTVAGLINGNSWLPSTGVAFLSGL